MSNQHTYQVPFTKEQLQSEYASGMSQTEIAQTHNTTQRVVFRAMQKFGIKARVAAKRNQTGENNSSWKGSNVGYAACHKRVEALRGTPKHCDQCDTSDPTKHYDWANLTGDYPNPNDYKRMCRSCHWKFDKKILNIKKMKELCRD